MSTKPGEDQIVTADRLELVQMFEIEVTHSRLDSSELPPKIRESFLEPRSFTHLGHIKWEEHCTECSWPVCYSSCDLYNPRNDANCRRTIDGFSPLLDMPVYGGYVVRVKFKRWCTLTACCHLPLRSVAELERVEAYLNRYSLLAAHASSFGTSIGRPGLLSRAVRRLKARSLSAGMSRRAEFIDLPNCFIMEVYNPGALAVSLSLDIAATHQKAHYIPFKRLLCVEPGFNRLRIPFDEIRNHLVNAHEVFLAINPNILRPEEEGLTLYFGVLSFACDASFVSERSVLLPEKFADKKSAASGKKVKVVVWDLDNTIWNGTLIEEGPGRVTLKPGIRQIIMDLDSRGIINSIASKNYAKDALAELDRFGLREYFVFPAISWGPKSEAVRQIRQSFAVGEDTIAFIDDQAFEREEVLARNPTIRVYPHDVIADLLERVEFNVPVTNEARGRRAFYQNEEVRQRALQESNGEYIEFLKQSNICIEIEWASPAQIDRIHELVQRTNQMNFSGNRYSKPELLAVLVNSLLDCYLIAAQDKFGKYGYIGFAVVRRGAVPRVIDLAFSCRVQSKRVEHAALIFLMRAYAGQGYGSLEVFRRVTDKNEQVAQVFPDLDFVQASRDGDDCVYRRDISTCISESDVVTVSFLDPKEHLIPTNLDRPLALEKSSKRDG
jgi:FkbH-like protein